MCIISIGLPDSPYACCILIGYDAIVSITSQASLPGYFRFQTKDLTDFMRGCITRRSINKSVSEINCCRLTKKIHETGITTTMSQEEASESYLVVCLPKGVCEVNLSLKGDETACSGSSMPIAVASGSSHSNAELCGLGVSVKVDEYRSWLTDNFVYSNPELQLVTRTNVVYTLLPTLLKNSNVCVLNFSCINKRSR